MVDQALNKKMEIQAKRAVDHSLREYKVKLDYSDESIKNVEKILSEFEATIPTGLMGRLLKRGPSPEEVTKTCEMYGGYIGEVFRRNFGGTWDYNSEFTDGKVVCLDMGKHGVIFPSMKIYKRLFQGKGDDVWFFYSAMKAKLQQEI